MKCRVLYISPSSGLGGAETFLAQTARYHLAGFEPIYVCFREGPLPAILRERGAKVFVAPSAPRLRNPISVLKVVLWLSKIIRQENIHLVHSSLAYGAIFGSLAVAFSRVPHLWFQHGPVEGWQDWLAGKLPSHLIIVNSEYTKNAQSKISPKRHFKSLKLGVVSDDSLGSNSKAIAKEKILAQMPGNEHVDFISTMICRPQIQKGIELWIQATAQLREKGISAGCLFIGGQPDGSAYEKSISRFAKEKKVPLVWMPATEHPWQLAIAADVLVCASVRPEGYGLTIAEAMMFGVCAVAPREGGPLDLLQEGKSGLFFTPRDPHSLAQVLQKIFLDPVLAAQMAHMGKKFAQEQLPAQQSIRQLEKIYLDLLGDLS